MSDDLIERHKKEMLFVEAGYGYGPALAEDMSITILELRTRSKEAVETLRKGFKSCDPTKTAAAIILAIAQLEGHGE
jgi:hypothetical protein